MPEARRHHFISQCYLRGFTDPTSDQQQLFVVDTSRNRTFRSSPANLAAERDFNRIASDQHPPDALESALAGFEGEVAPRLEQIRAARSIQDRDAWIWVLNLAALFAVRTPRFRDMMNNQREQMSKLMLGMTLHSRDRWEAQLAAAKDAGEVDAEAQLTYEEAKEFFERDEFSIETPRDTHIRSELKLVPTVIELLVRRNWTLCHAPEGSGGIITCDNPVALNWIDPDAASGFYPPGYGVSGTAVTIPISRELIAIGIFESTKVETVLTARQTAVYNAVTGSNASHQLYAAGDDFQVETRGQGRVKGKDLLESMARAKASKEKG